MTDKSHPRNWTPEERRAGLLKIQLERRRELRKQFNLSENVPGDPDLPLSTAAELAAIDAEFMRELSDEELAELVRKAGP